MKARRTAGRTGKRAKSILDDLEKIDKENKSSRAANLGLGSNKDENKELDETIKSFPFEKMIINNDEQESLTKDSKRFKVCSIATF